MSGRGVRSGRAVRGFPPGSAQALVALVLGVVAAVVGLRRGEGGWAVLFAVVAALGALQLARLVRRRPGRRRPGRGGRRAGTRVP